MFRCRSLIARNCSKRKPNCWDLRFRDIRSICYSHVQWNTYCPIADVGNYPTRRVTVAGMIVEDRLHHQMDGRIMKFISICDYSGILECELFASAYRRFGAETIRHPIVEVRGKVKPFANRNGYTLQVETVRRARM